MSGLFSPPALQSGDTIGLVSIASKVNREEIQPGIRLLESMGFRILQAQHIWSEHHTYAGTDLQRAADLQHMIDHPHLKAIICTRGGYGTLRTLQYTDWRTFFKKPKWIAGFSDITVLHSKLHQAGLQSIHGVMPKHFLKEGNPTTSFQTLIGALIDDPVQYQFDSHPLNRSGQATGQLVGGNLSILCSLRGTPYDLDPRGKILFIEDLDEYLYHLDRMMMNLKAGGFLDHLAGLVVGGLTSMKEGTVPFGMTAHEIILDAVKEFDYPVAFNFPAGHQEENFALRLGEEICLSVGQTHSTLESLLS